MLILCVETQVCLRGEIQLTFKTSYVVSLIKVILEPMFSSQSSEVDKSQFAGGTS